MKTFYAVEFNGPDRHINVVLDAEQLTEFAWIQSEVHLNSPVSGEPITFKVETLFDYEPEEIEDLMPPPTRWKARLMTDEEQKEFDERFGPPDY